MTATQRSGEYPSEMTGVYTSIVLLMLSILLAILLLKEKTWLLLYYSISSIFVTGAVFAVKHHILSRRATTLPNNNIHKNTEEEQDRGPGKRLLILTLFALILALTIPIFLVGFLDPSSWVILLISYTTGVSGAEILRYLYLLKHSR